MNNTFTDILFTIFFECYENILGKMIISTRGGTVKESKSREAASEGLVVLHIIIGHQSLSVQCG